MKIKHILFFVKSILIYSLLFCKSYIDSPYSCYKIEGIAGPEDFVYLEEGIFLVSSHNRRDLESLGEIYSYNPKTNQVQLIPRINEPENFSFRPHGIDYRKPYLYVILHGNTMDTKWHSVAIYEFKNNELIFKKNFQHELIVSPNDLITLSENEFYITNDMKHRASYFELFKTLFLGINYGSIAYCNMEKQFCQIVSDELGFPNSLAIVDRKLFVSTTLENKIYEFRIDKNNPAILTSKKEVAEIAGADNIIYYNEKLYITSHPSIMRFMQHSSNAEKYSPSLAYEIDPNTYKTVPIFEDSGKKISAASVIIKLNKELFIGQVFNPYLLRCTVG
jgi:hypothetical protein